MIPCVCKIQIAIGKHKGEYPFEKEQVMFSTEN